MSGYTINTMSAELGLSSFYIRKCIREDKIKTTRVQVDDTKVYRHEISEQDFNLFKNRERKGFGKRDDGRNKYTIYLTQSELSTLQDLIEDEEYSSLLQRSNPSKNNR